MEVEHKKAYELYASGYNYSEISRILKVTRKTVAEWSKKEGWVELKKDRDIKDAELIREETLKGRELLLSVIDIGAKQLAENIKNGKKVLEPKDLQMLVDTYTKLNESLTQELKADELDNKVLFTFDIKGRPNEEKKLESEVEEDEGNKS